MSTYEERPSHIFRGSDGCENSGKISSKIRVWHLKRHKIFHFSPFNGLFYLNLFFSSFFSCQPLNRANKLGSFTESKPSSRN